MWLLKSALGVALGLALALAPGASSADQAEITAPFARTGADRDARGHARLNVWPKAAYLHVKVERLAPNARYQLRANDLVQATLATDGRGNAEGFFYLFPADGSEPALYVDPRGKLLTIVDRNDRPVLSMVFSGHLEPANIVVDELVELTPSSRVPRDGWGRAEFHRGADGRRWLEVTALGMDLGEQHELRVDGRRRATLYPGGTRGWAQARMNNLPDPRRKSIEIVDSRGRTIFSGKLLSKIPGANTVRPPTGPETVQFTVLVPDYSPSNVVGLRLWRREPSQSQWREERLIFIWPADPGDRRVEYSFINPRTGRMDVDRVQATRAFWGAGGALTLTIDYLRTGAEALFKISALNVVGESPRSQNTVLR